MVDRERVSSDNIASAAELLEQARFTFPISHDVLKVGSMTKFNLSEVEAAYPILLRAVGQQVFRREFYFEETGSASYVGTMLHEIDALGHYLYLGNIRPDVNDFFPTQSSESLGRYREVVGMFHPDDSPHWIVRQYVSMSQSEFDARPHNVPLNSNFKIVDEVFQRRENGDLLLASGTKLMNYWRQGGVDHIGSIPGSRTYREVSTVLNIRELGLQCIVRLDGLITGGRYKKDMVIDLKSGSDMQDDLGESVRLRQAQMMGFAAGVLLLQKQKNGNLPGTGKVAVCDVKNLTRTVDGFGHHPVNVLYRYFDKQTGKFRYVGFTIDKEQAEDFVTWFTALAMMIRSDPWAYKKELSKQKAINL